MLGMMAEVACAMVAVGETYIYISLTCYLLNGELGPETFITLSRRHVGSLCSRTNPFFSFLVAALVIFDSLVIPNTNWIQLTRDTIIHMLADKILIRTPWKNPPVLPHIT